ISRSWSLRQNSLQDVEHIRHYCARSSGSRHGYPTHNNHEEAVITPAHSPSCRPLANSPTVRRMIRTFHGIKPIIPTSCFIEETSIVIGDVVLGEHCSVWFHAVIRGDVHYIRIGDRTNVQDLCMLHVTHDTRPLIIGHEVTIGHSAILHG